MTQPPDILFLRDDDGDGIADTREPLCSGFPVANTQHNINGLTWGLDNWVYAVEHNLYIPTRELVRLNAYQAQVIQIQYASPVGWAPEVEDEMVAHVERMVAGILE